MSAGPPAPGDRRAALEALWRQGRSAWPALELGLDAFIAWVESRLPAAQDPSQLVAADLYLSVACLCGVPGAAAAFVDGPLAATERHLDTILRSPEARQEHLQALAVFLLAPDPTGAEPRLAQYSGRGALAVWLRMTATRRALNLERGKKKVVSLDDTAPDRLAQIADSDPELSVLRRRHKDEIAAIFREATAATPADERVLLRLHYVQGSTLNELAALYHTSRSSLHRRIEAAREALMARIASLVKARMRIDQSQQGSMLQIFQSDLREQLRLMLRDEA